MALIKCSECGNDVSSNATTCPRCGNPVARAVQTKAVSTQATTAQAPTAGIGRYKPLLIPGAIAAIIFGLTWMAGHDQPSTPHPQPETPEHRAEALKAKQEFEGKQAAEKAERAAKFTAERETIIVKAKSLYAQHKWPELIEMDNEYAWANDSELNRMTSVARNKVAEIAMAKEKKAAEIAMTKEKAERRKQGIAIGMTKGEVLASSWGKPQGINKSIYASGTHEQWVYGGGNYVYFSGDVVTSIQTGR